jgi:outer membrane protein assembly factor BamB
VVALDHEGREVWRTDLGPYRAGHGFGASPIVHDGALVVPNDQDGASALVAFEGRSGKKLWQLPRKSRASYSTPCLYHPPQGPAQLIVTSYEQGVTSVDPATGKVNWQLDVFDKGHVEAAIGSPVVAGDVILAGCGWLGVRHEVVALRGQDPARLYCLDRSAPLCTTPLVHEGLIYLWSDRGIVSCAELATGEVHWRERVPGSYYSSPIAWVGHIANVSREGDVVVLAAGKRFTQLAANPVGAGSHSTPAIAGGRIFVRTFTELLCVGPR